MENFNLKIGMNASAEIDVSGKNTAEEFGSGSLDVYASPSMVCLMERAALSSVDLHLPAEYASVGTMLDIRHLAATPTGMKVRAVATLVEIHDRRLVFRVEAFDEVEKIGEGMHERYIVNAERFRNKAYSKR